MAQPKVFAVSIDLSKHELLNAVVQNLASAPGTPKVGQIYYNTGDDILYGWNGTSWIDMMGGSGYVHPGATNPSLTPTLTGANVLATFQTDGEGHVDVLTTRTLTLSDLGYTPYSHPAGGTLAGAPLTAAAVISDVTVDAQGHITGFATRNLTAADIGAAIINDSVTNSVDGWSSTKITNEIAAAVAGVTSTPTILGYDANTNTPDLDVALGAGVVFKGDIYHVTAAGDFFGEAVEIGDTLIAKIDDPATLDNWVRLEKNVTINSATDAVEGIIRLATQAEVLAGTDGLTAVTPLDLQAKLDGLTLLKKFSATIGDGAAVSFTITHNFATDDVIANVKEIASNAEIITEVTTPTVNTVGVAFNVAPALNSHRVNVIG